MSIINYLYFPTIGVQRLIIPNFIIGYDFIGFNIVLIVTNNFHSRFIEILAFEIFGFRGAFTNHYFVRQSRLYDVFFTFRRYEFVNVGAALVKTIFRVRAFTVGVCVHLYSHQRRKIRVAHFDKRIVCRKRSIRIALVVGYRLVCARRIAHFYRHSVPTESFACFIRRLTRILGYNQPHGLPFRHDGYILICCLSAARNRYAAVA